MKQKSESVFNRFLKIQDTPSEPEAKTSDENDNGDESFFQSSDHQNLYVTTPALYENFLKGGNPNDCFIKPESIEPLQGTLYYQDRYNRIIYKMLVQIDQKNDSEQPEVLLLPSHALSLEQPIFIAIIGKCGTGKTTLLTEIAAIGERLLCSYSPVAQCQIDIDYPVASQPYLDMRDKRDAFLKGSLPAPTVPEGEPNDHLYPLFIRSGIKERLFVFRDFPGEVLAQGTVPGARYKDFLFIIDAEDILCGLKDPFYCSGNEEILNNLLAFMPDYQMSAVFIQVVMTKVDLLRSWLEDNAQETPNSKSSAQLEKEAAARNCIQSLLEPISFDRFISDMQNHQDACHALMRLADPVFMNRLELNLIIDGVPHFCVNGVSVLGKPTERSETVNFDLQNLEPVNMAAFLYGFLQAYSIFDVAYENEKFFEESPQEETDAPEELLDENFRDADYLNRVMEQLQDIYDQKAAEPHSVPVED